MTLSVHQLQMPADVGVLLVGHGTRHEPGVDEFMSLAGLFAGREAVRPVAPCFLELAEPTIAQGVARLVEQGARRIVVAPVILFAAGHIRRDIPRAVAEAAQLHGGVRCMQSPHLGCHPDLLRLAAKRFDETLHGAPRMAAEETVLVLVGRGSRDSQATREMLDYAELRHEASPVGSTRTAFLAMADPPVQTVLDQLAKQGVRRIIVQPHLLFAGELLGRIRSLVDRMRAEYPATDWRLVPHLGPDELVASAVCQRIAEMVATTGLRI